MFKRLKDILQIISTDDEHNIVPGMMRVGWLLGLSVYLLGGLAMTAVMLKIAWTTKTAADYQAFGIGFAAWLAGLSAYIVAGSSALWIQAKADALPSVVVTKTVETPPITTTVTTETPVEKDK